MTTCLQLGCEHNYACKCNLEGPNITIENGSDDCLDYTPAKAEDEPPQSHAESDEEYSDCEECLVSAKTILSKKCPYHPCPCDVTPTDAMIDEIDTQW